MAVVIRLSRHGTNKKPMYRIVAADKEFPRDGRYLEILGTYNPKEVHGQGALNEERLKYWISKGAKPTLAVKHLIKRSQKVA